MKKTLRYFQFRLLVIIVLFLGIRAQASHILGGNLIYEHVSGLTYKVTLTLFGDCGSTTGAFPTLTISTPHICIYDGATTVSDIYLSAPTILCGTEVTALCAGDTTNCASPGSLIQGVMKFVYTGTVTLPHTSTCWRFIYTGDNGSTAGSWSCTGAIGTGTSTASAAARTASITNISSPGATYIELIDTLNNSTFSDNNSAYFNTYPALYYHINQSQNYNPSASDPDADSLVFSLIDANNGSGTSCSSGTGLSYTGTAWTGTPVSGTTPLQVVAGTFSMNSMNGQLAFKPNAMQRSVVVYNVREFRGGVFIGNSQQEVTISVPSGSFSGPCTNMPNAGVASASYNCMTGNYLLSLSGYSCAGVALQWQQSANNTTWANLSGATTSTYLFAPTTAMYYRCAVTCISSAMTAYSGNIFFNPPGSTGFNSAVINNSDSACGAGAHFYVSTCAPSPSYTVVTYYGDGTSDITTMTTTTPCYANIFHSYGASGTYFVKQVLFDGSVPIDSTRFAFEYLRCSALPMRYYYDANNNCVYDAGDTKVIIPMSTAIDSDGVRIDTVVSTSGFNYRARGNDGTVYSFRPLLTAASGVLVNCPSTGFVNDTIQPGINSYPVKDMGLICGTASSHDFSVHAIMLGSGSHNQSGSIYVSNLTCLATNATITLIHSPKYPFQSGTPTPTSVSGNSVTWNVAGLANFSSPMHFSYSLEGAHGLTMGDTTQSYYSISPIVGDIDPSNNQFIIIDTITTSWDPNKISVTPSGYISAGTQLQYTINFENTGNDTAFFIHVMDTLSDFLDVRSLEIVAASHAMNLSVYNDDNHNIVKFDYPNINLLDSSHHGECDGMVIFNINIYPGLANGTVIYNRAGIYFDYNPVVMTNTAVDIIGIPNRVGSVLSDKDINIYPNPATSELTIKTTNEILNSIAITNTVGQVLRDQPVNSRQTTINISRLPAGLYFVTCKNEQGAVVKKFIKE
jgi:uncharacterized repeat protein (TIGR01451 family)